MTASRHLSPKLAREQRHDSLRRLIRQAIHDHSTPLEQLALDLGISRQLLARYLSDVEPAELHAADVEALPPLIRRPIVDALAESLGCTLAELPDVEQPGSDLRLLADVATRSAAAIEAKARAIADGAITAAEGAELERAGTDLMCVGATLRNRGRDAQRERVVGVVGVRVVGGTATGGGGKR